MTKERKLTIILLIVAVVSLILAISLFSIAKMLLGQGIG